MYQEIYNKKNITVGTKCSFIRRVYFSIAEQEVRIRDGQSRGDDGPSFTPYFD